MNDKVVTLFMTKRRKKSLYLDQLDAERISLNFIICAYETFCYTKSMYLASYQNSTEMPHEKVKEEIILLLSFKLALDEFTQQIGTTTENILNLHPVGVEVIKYFKTLSDIVKDDIQPHRGYYNKLIECLKDK